MKISSATIEVLTGIITGDSNISGRRTGQKIVDFFNDFGIDDISINGLSRNDYTKEKLKLLNGTEEIKKIIHEVTDPIYDTKENPVLEVAVSLEKYLRKDGYKLVSEYDYRRDTYPTEIVDIYEVIDDPMEQEEYLAKLKAKHYRVKKIEDGDIFVNTSQINALSHEFINEQSNKIRQKLLSGDNDGVITNVRSILEAVQEEIIKKSNGTVPDHSGDLIKLYKEVRKNLNLDADNNISEVLKQILSGLNSINTGLAGLSNKASDRHSRKYKPARHHAKLAIETGFAFCEFLIASYEYQKNLLNKN